MSLFSIFAGVPRAARWMAGSLAAIAIAAASIPIQAATATLSGVGSCTYTTVSVDGNGNINVTCSNTPLAGQLSFGQTTYSANTNDPSFQVQVTRTGGSAGAVTVPVSLTGPACTAISGSPVSFADLDTAPKALTVSTGSSGGTCTLSFGTPTTGAPTLGANATINVIDPTAPGAFQFETASSSANINVTNHIVRIVRTGGSNGTYDVLWGFTVAGLTGVAAAPNPVRFNSGEIAKDITITSGTTAGTLGMTLVGANNVNPALQNGPYPVAPTVGNASVGTITAHTVTVAASSSCPTPGANVTMKPVPANANTQNPMFNQTAGMVAAIAMPIGAPNTNRLRVYNTSQTGDNLTLTFSLSQCPGQIDNPASPPAAQWGYSNAAPCRKTASGTGNSMTLTSVAPTPIVIGGTTYVNWGGNCGWLTADRASQWYFNIRVENCASGNCQFYYSIDNGTGSGSY